MCKEVLKNAPGLFEIDFLYAFCSTMKGRVRSTFFMISLEEISHRVLSFFFFDDVVSFYRYILILLRFPSSVHDNARDFFAAFLDCIYFSAAPISLSLSLSSVLLVFPSGSSVKDIFLSSPSLFFHLHLFFY